MQMLADAQAVKRLQQCMFDKMAAARCTLRSHDIMTSHATCQPALCRHLLHLACLLALVYQARQVRRVAVIGTGSNISNVLHVICYMS